MVKNRFFRWKWGNSVNRISPSVKNKKITELNKKKKTEQSTQCSYLKYPTNRAQLVFHFFRIKINSFLDATYTLIFRFFENYLFTLFSNERNDSRLPTPRSSRSSVDRVQQSSKYGMNGYSQSPNTLNRTLVNTTNTNLNKPPPAPTPQTVSNQMSSRGGRPLMSYQRSATTSIVPTVQAKLNQIQKQQQQLQQMQQMRVANTTNNMSRTSTNQSLASSNSTSTIASSNASTSVTNPMSPPSSASVSASSSLHHIVPNQQQQTDSGNVK